MKLFENIGNFFRYLFSKRSEVQQFEVRDLYMTKVILQIHQQRTHKSVEAVPLNSLLPIHVLDRETALATLEERIAMLELNKETILKDGVISCAMLAEYLPSVSWIKVVADGRGKFLAFEGNSRIYAMQKAFAAGPELMVEVEQYHFKRPLRIVRRLRKVRRMNGLRPTL